jgi:hypothetical protein
MMELEDRIVEFIYDGNRCPGEVIEFVIRTNITVMVGGDKTNLYKFNYIGDNTWQTEDERGILEGWNFDPNQRANWVKVKR